MNFIRKNIFWISILAIAFLMLSTTGLTIYSSQSIEKNSTLLGKIELIKSHTSQILTGTMHGLDLGVRGYAILKQEGLLNPYDRAIAENEAIFSQLHDLLVEIKYPTSGLDSVHFEVNQYIEMSKEMVQNIRIDSMDKVKSVLKEDRGYTVWKQFESYRSHLFIYLDSLENEALAQNLKSQSNLLAIQIIMLLVSFPIFGFIIYKIKSDKTERLKLVKELDTYNKSYVFNSGIQTVDFEEKQIIENSIKDMKEAVGFVKAITQGNYEVEWQGYTPENSQLNADNLSGHLHKMREKMVEVKAEDQRKIWINEGLADFAKLVREFSNSDLLMDKVVSFIANYLSVNQVWLFDR
ncbi:MAG: hypothetical protein K2Q22_17285, partial [Cytophagales bacterium]|nr:hypothetical protein [Cytophagales bacterium]